MKKLTALLLATSLSMTLFGCNNKDKGTQEKGKDTMVSVWLVTSETEYEADGSKGTSQRIYTYNEKGMPLSLSLDRGSMENVWNDELGMFTQILHPFDGDVDTQVDYYYNDRGDFLYGEQSMKMGNGDGEETTNVSLFAGYGRKVDAHYTDDGKLDSLDVYAQIGDQVTNQIANTIHYCYDEDGRLIEVYSTAEDYSQWINEYRYDDQGRIIGLTVRQREYSCYFQFEYNDNGKISHITESRGGYQTPLDDKQVSLSSTASRDTVFTLREEIECTYDENGNLISRGKDTCTYQNGKLHTVTYGDGTKIIYVDNEADAAPAPDTQTYVLDKNGNPVKLINEDGSYVVFTYQEFRLTKDEAVKCHNVYVANNHINFLGWSLYPTVSLAPHITYLPQIPFTDLYQTDYLKNRFG